MPAGLNLDTLVCQALDLVDSALSSGVQIRVFGGIGIRLQVDERSDLYEGLRRMPADIDIVTLKRDSKDLATIMKDLGYKPDERFNLYHGNARQLWYSDTHQVDVFFDKLQLCHVIDLRKRIDLDKPALNVTDLFLSKMQIVEVNEKDLIDMIMLLLEHDLTSTGRRIDLNYICNLLSSDWGFFHTVEINLSRIERFAQIQKVLDRDDKINLLSKVSLIKKAMHETDKSYTWKLRSLIGEKKKWYNEVEEITRLFIPKISIPLRNLSLCSFSM